MLESKQKVWKKILVPKLGIRPVVRGRTKPHLGRIFLELSAGIFGAVVTGFQVKEGWKLEQPTDPRRPAVCGRKREGRPS